MRQSPPLRSLRSALLPAFLAASVLAAPALAKTRLVVDQLAVGGLSEFRAQHRVGNGSQASLFGQDVQSDFEHGPVVLYRINERWQKAEVGPASQLGWVHVGALGKDGAVGILDNDVESTGWELTILRRPDSRSHWRVTAEIKKPYYLATFDRLHETPTGELELDVVLDESYGSRWAPGRYRARSRDQAKTWSAFERVGAAD